MDTRGTWYGVPRRVRGGAVAGYATAVAVADIEAASAAAAGGGEKGYVSEYYGDGVTGIRERVDFWDKKDANEQ